MISAQNDKNYICFVVCWFVCVSFNFVNQAKFLFMVRDGRATVNSIISRKVTITGFDLTSYRQCMSKWNHAIETMHNQCKEIGSDKCMMVSSCKQFLFYLKMTALFAELAQFDGKFAIRFISISIPFATLPPPCRKSINHPKRTGLLWAVGATSRRMDAEDFEIFRYSMERFRITSWRVYQQTKWCLIIKVRNICISFYFNSFLPFPLI